MKIPSVDEQTSRDGVGPHVVQRYSPGLLLPLTSGDPKEDSMLVYYIYDAFPPFLAARQSTRNWRRMTSFVSLLPRKRSLVPVRFHRLNCSSVVAIVAEIVETKIFLLAREVENKTDKGEIVLISEC